MSNSKEWLKQLSFEIDRFIEGYFLALTKR